MTERQDETALIRRLSEGLGPKDPARIPLGIGDDAALVEAREGYQLVVCADAMLVGRHFPADLSPAAIAHRALASNLSDLAAMGGEPLGFLLCLALPEDDEIMLDGMREGFAALAETCPLIGGDLTRGPLNLSITVLGEVPRGEALTRNGARPGDLVCMSGHPGDAAIGLKLMESGRVLDHSLRAAFEIPEPRLSLGRDLRGLASACIDVSDGLAQDLSRVLVASGVGARLSLPSLPISDAAWACGLPAAEVEHHALTGGDDYELLFTLAPEDVHAVKDHPEGVTVIGEVIEGEGLVLLDADGQRVERTLEGWDPFRSAQ